uniref:Nardilysin n=1 Tax=Strigamia maritima TaxID=126957 RepID=T1J428_STRMM
MFRSRSLLKRKLSSETEGQCFKQKYRESVMSNAIETPIKSPNDNREYLIIRLENGLRALLISDLSENNDVDADEDSEMEESDVDEGDDEESEDEDSEGEINSLSTGKQNEKLCKKAAAGLCIGVGSFSDPEDLPGLAHFLEHMVFMGSEKYPVENAFDALIKRSGGNDNAETDCERTIFYFDVHTKHFRSALDHFAQFFISPLLKIDSMQREMESVDSEFQMNLTSDSLRKQQLLGQLTKVGHPMSKFMWGNLKTLKTDPAEQKIDVYARLKEFWQTYYSAQYMTLVVQSRETLSTLESWVKESFSQVPNNGLPAFNFDHFSNPFDGTLFYKMYKVIPVKNIHQVELMWSLPSLQKHYRIKPHCYIFWLLGHEGEGSILSYLKSKIWALSLYSGNDETGFEHNSTYASFTVTVGLTEEGLDNLFQVITTIFQYLEMLRRHGPDARIYSEIQTIEKNNFRWQEETDASDYVQNLCENMQLYPPEDYICGDQLLFEFDSQVIAEVQNLLVPDRCNITVMSNRFEKEKGEKKYEQWFKTPYFETEIDPDWLLAWKNLAPNENLYLPEVNKYIATDFEIKQPDRPESEFPVKIVDTPQSCLWYKKDTKFLIPKAYVYFHLVTPFVNSSPQTAALLDIFVNVLAQNLSEAIYPADVAQLFYNLLGYETGLVIQVYGFNEKLYMLLETILNHIDHFTVNKDLFEAVKNHLIKQYYNNFIKPGKLCTEVRLSLLQQYHWTVIDKRAAILDINSDMLGPFVNNLKSHLFLEGLVQGNITSKESLEILALVESKLNCKPLPRHLYPDIRVMQLEKGEKLCSVAVFNPEDSNSVVTNYYQSGAGSIHNSCLMELLIALMEEPCFDVLRTQQQLGYNVNCMFRNTFGIVGFSVTVHTQADKYSCKLVDERIEAFLQLFLNKLVSEISEKEFETQVSSLIRLKSCVDLRLKEEVNRNWSEILCANYLFNRSQLEIDDLKKISLADVRTWYKDHLWSGNKFYKLGIQVVGNQSKDGNQRAETKRHQSPHNLVHCSEKASRSHSRGELNKTVIHQLSKDLVDETRQKSYELQFLKDPESGNNQDTYICDVMRYKEGLALFPVVKIVK